MILPEFANPVLDELLGRSRRDRRDHGGTSPQKRLQDAIGRAIGKRVALRKRSRRHIVHTHDLPGHRKRTDIAETEQAALHVAGQYELLPDMTGLLRRYPRPNGLQIKIGSGISRQDQLDLEVSHVEVPAIEFIVQSADDFTRVTLNARRSLRQEPTVDAPGSRHQVSSLAASVPQLQFAARLDATELSKRLNGRTQEYPSRSIDMTLPAPNGRRTGPLVRTALRRVQSQQARFPGKRCVE